MTEQEWLTSDDPLAMLEFLGDGASPRKLRLFAVACARQVWDKLKVQRHRQAVEITDKFADGKLHRENLQQSWAEVWPGNWSAPCSFEPAELVGALVLCSALWPAEKMAWATAVACAGTRSSRRLRTNIWHDAYSVWFIARAQADGEPDYRNRWKRLVEAFRGHVERQEMPAREAFRVQADLLRDIFGTPAVLAPLVPIPARLGSAVTEIARSIYAARAFEDMPILADALEEAGCPDAMIQHCRAGGPHTRGCWMLDLLMEKA
jgi:hypothetical protein